MDIEDLVRHCFEMHLHDLSGNVYFTFQEYKDFWINHTQGDVYELLNKDHSVEQCTVVYYPIPYYPSLRALVEIMKEGHSDYREVPVKFLRKKR
jgi:hypothetical protein